MTESVRMRWALFVSRMGAKIIAYRGLLRRHEEERPLRRPRRRCEDAIKIKLKGYKSEGVYWICLG
jgi:hypothetical protein